MAKRIRLGRGLRLAALFALVWAALLPGAAAADDPPAMLLPLSCDAALSGNNLILGFNQEILEMMERPENSCETAHHRLLLDATQSCLGVLVARLENLADMTAIHLSGPDPELADGVERRMRELVLMVGMQESVCRSLMDEVSLNMPDFFDRVRPEADELYRAVSRVSRAGEPLEEAASGYSPASGASVN